MPASAAALINQPDKASSPTVASNVSIPNNHANAHMPRRLAAK